ncbi:MAG: PKD domain-containing protein [Flavobacteriales bacterium]
MRILSLLSALLLSFFNEVCATHIVGGDIHYECTGGNTYTIIMKIYRDCYNGISPYDDPASVGVFDQFGNLVENIEIPLSSSTIDTLNTDTGDPCLIAPTNVCVTECVYTASVQLDVPAGGLTLAYQRCCRNTSIVNCASNDDIGMTITAFIPDPSLAVCNSNPAFINFPPVFICLNSPFSMDHSATDLDGDSLAYTFCNPLLENMPTNYINPPGAPPYPLLQFYPEFSASYPIASNPAFNIDPITGLLTGTPNELGQYVVGICVEEYRNGVLISNTNRDFQFNVTLCGQSTVANIDPPLPCSGLTVSLGNNSTGQFYFWDFGDGTVLTDTTSIEEPSYTYTAEGIYEVMLIANPGFSCADTQFVQVPVFNEFFVDITYSVECVNYQLVYDFEPEGTWAGTMQWQWTFEDGIPPTSNQQTIYDVIFGGDTQYDIMLNASNGYCDALVLETITPPELPSATIAQQQDFCEGLTIDFTLSSNNEGNDILWDFGDAIAGDTSTEIAPSYTYSDYGTYTVTVTASPESDCPGQSTATVVVLPPDPIDGNVSISEPDLCDTIPHIDAAWNGSGTTEIEWNFGDGGISEEASLEYIYDVPGNYIVTFTAYNEVCDYTELFETPVGVGFGPIISEVIVPNVFTPNSDGKNELFRMYYRNEAMLIPPGRTFDNYLTYYHLRIWNRWGNLMYDSETDGKQGWDGDLNNDSKDGVYYYILDYQRACIDDEIKSKDGHFELLR